HFLIYCPPHYHDSAHFLLNDPATTEIYTLSLHDALPISGLVISASSQVSPSSLLISTFEIPRSPPKAIPRSSTGFPTWNGGWPLDRKSTRLNSSHGSISYAVFCLKKKKKITNPIEDLGDRIADYALEMVTLVKKKKQHHVYSLSETVVRCIEYTRT